MQDQNFQNHTRLVTLYHKITYPILLGILVGAGVNLGNSSKDNLYSASLIFALAMVVSITLFYARGFALKANDRAIRAEENFRHYLLTGKPLPKSLRLGQIVALRFASDEELPALAQQAVDGQLKSKDIKAAIKNWKPDYERV
jgi:low temperature requirement protein LtrA